MTGWDTGLTEAKPSSRFHVWLAGIGAGQDGVATGGVRSRESPSENGAEGETPLRDAEPTISYTPAQVPVRANRTHGWPGDQEPSQSHKAAAVRT